VFTAEAVYIDAVITQPMFKNIAFQAKLATSFWSLTDNNDNDD